MEKKNKENESYANKIEGVIIKNEFDVVGTESVSLGRFFIRCDTVRKDGKSYPYSYIEGKDSVAILGEKDGKFIFIRQYRHSVKEELLEIPGGAVEKDEDPVETARREMLEETGYVMRNLIHVGAFYPTVGASNELCHLFYGQCGEYMGQQLEALEKVEVLELGCDEVEKAITDGKLMHSMALVSWLKYKMMKVSRKNAD